MINDAYNNFFVLPNSKWMDIFADDMINSGTAQSWSYGFTWASLFDFDPQKGLAWVTLFFLSKWRGLLEELRYQFSRWAVHSICYSPMVPGPLQVQYVVFRP